MKSPKSNGSSNNKFTISEFGYYKQCSRFLPLERANEFSTQDAVIYDRLRQAGMKRNKALKFCKGQHCKIDSTQTKHGPPGFKIFNTKIDKLKQLNGWQMVGRLNYEQSMREEYSDDSEWQIQDQNKEEQEKMEQLKQFYTDLDLKYSFNEMDQQETLTKLRSLSTEQQYRSRVPQYQLKDGKNKMMYYEMAEYILQLKKPPNTLIQELNVFDDTIPLVRQEYFDIKPKYIEKATPFYPKQNCEKRSKLLKELTRAYTGNITITEPAEEIKKYSYKLDFNNSHYVKGFKQQTPNESVLSSLNDIDQQSTKKIKQRCSIMTHRITKFSPQDKEVIKYNEFRNKLEEIVNKSIKRMNCETNNPIF